jgi:hypothetical protein
MADFDFQNYRVANIDYQLYKTDEEQPWRWTALFIPNGETIGAGSEAFANRSDAVYNCQLLTGFEPRLVERPEVGAATIEEEETDG